MTVAFVFCFARARVCACVLACMRACVRVCACARVCVCVCARAAFVKILSLIHISEPTRPP